jgi:hypothetical protein
MAMPRTRVLAFLGALLVLALAGCGGGGDGGGTTAAAPGTGAASTGEQPPVSENLKVYPVESAGFSIGVPKGWKAIDSDTVSAAAEEATKDNPQLKQVFDAMRQTGTRIRLAAGDPKPIDDFSTNMNVVVEPVDSKVTLDAYRDANVNAVKSVLGATPEIENVDLPAGEAAKFSYTTSQGGKTIKYLQYALVNDGNGYVLTFTTTPASGTKYDSLFQESAESFRFL